MKCIWLAFAPIVLMGCANTTREPSTGCGVHAGLKLSVHVTRENKDAVIVDVSFEKMEDYGWSLRVAGPVFITWYDDSNEVVGHDVFKMIFDEDFRRGDQRADESNARSFPPKAARSFTAKCGGSLITERARIRG